MRGRGAEFETVLGLLDSTQQGQGQVLLVEGEPGTGKSLLLARADEEAGHRGFLLVVAAAGELSPALCSRRSTPRGATRGNGAGRRETTAPAPWADVLLAGVALVGDVLGAIPDQGLIELAADAAGNPLILTEAFRGLRDENAIVVRGGHASLVPAQASGAHVTSRIEALARHRLKGLSVGARQFVETASILGSSSRLEDVGEMLGESPGAMLAALDEALSAYLLMVSADGLAFRHEFIRQAVARMLAEPIQQALHRQFGQMLLARGGSAVPAAYHLIRGARPGDAQALAGLDRAVTELAPFAPQAAAELATGALALTLPSDPGRRPARPPRSGRSQRQASGTRRRPWSGRRSRYRCLRARARRCGARWRRCWP